MYNIVKVVVFMNIDLFYYVVLGITVISYVLGLFLSYFEKKGRISVLSSMGNVGFVNIYGVNQEPPTPEVVEQQEEEPSKYFDEEII